MQQNIQNLDFDEKVEKFCEVNNLTIPNLANLIIIGNERAASIILNAELETIVNNTVFSGEKLDKLLKAYNLKLGQLESQFTYLSNWSGLTHRNWQIRVYSSQMLMKKLLAHDLKSYVYKQKEFDAQTEENVSNLDTIKQKSAMNMIDKEIRDIEIFKIEEDFNATERSIIR